jgi:hypothetical protein
MMENAKQRNFKWGCIPKEQLISDFSMGFCSPARQIPGYDLSVDDS